MFVYSLLTLIVRPCLVTMSATVHNTLWEKHTEENSKLKDGKYIGVELKAVRSKRMHGPVRMRAGLRMRAPITMRVLGILKDRIG